MQNNTEVKPDEFQVGDVVWCVLHGKGEVTYIESSGPATYPVEVCFDDGVSIWYTQDGKYIEGLNRSLFFSEPKIEASVTRPFVPTLVGKKVVVVLEYACYPQVFVVTWEDESMFGNDEYKCIKSNSTVYEVSSENLLTK